MSCMTMLAVCQLIMRLPTHNEGIPPQEVVLGREHVHAAALAAAAPRLLAKQLRHHLVRIGG